MSMDDLAHVAPAFIEMAHRIVWCSAATVDTHGRPRSRILHPIWQWDGQQLLIFHFPAWPNEITCVPAIKANNINQYYEKKREDLGGVGVRASL